KVMANNIVEMSIHGITLKVSTVEDEEYVNSLAETLSGDMDSLFDQSPNISISDAIVLCAIDYLDKYQKSKQSSANMRVQLKEYLADAASAKVMLEEEKKQVAVANAQAAELRATIDELRNAAPVVDESQTEKINEALKEIEELKQVNDSAVAQCTSLNERIDALNSYIANQGSELDRLKAENDELKGQNAGLKAQYDGLKDKLADYDKLSYDFENAKKENETLFSELSKVKADNANAQKEVDDLQRELLRLSDTINQRTQSSYEPKPTPTYDSVQSNLFDDLETYDKSVSDIYDEPSEDFDDDLNLNWVKDI
ncbi:MAG: cell division protein ZapA, partial [Oscillospiraceae bacterium]|nr:cell division protein ZapA [Oscillospiraceae bacterium]